MVPSQPGGSSGSRPLSTGISGEIYVENAETPPNGDLTWTSVYAPGTLKLLRRIPGNNDGDNSGIGFDSKGNFYWEDDINSTISVVAPNKTTPSYVITDGVYSPEALVLDGKNDLWVANYPQDQNPYGAAFVSYYHSATATPTKILRKGLLTIPSRLALDSAGDLYVLNQGSYAAPGGNGDITVYAQGATRPFRTITQGVAGPSDMILGSDGKLYVANEGVYGRVSYQSSVTIYASGAISPASTITDGVTIPTALALDGKNNLYVANRGNNTVSVYAPGQTSPTYTIALTGKGEGPNALTFDRAGNLYVVNYSGGYFNGSLCVYPPGATTPSITVTEGILRPGAVAIAP